MGASALGVNPQWATWLPRQVLWRSAADEDPGYLEPNELHGFSIWVSKTWLAQHTAQHAVAIGSTLVGALKFLLGFLLVSFLNKRVGQTHFDTNLSLWVRFLLRLGTLGKCRKSETQSQPGFSRGLFARPRLPAQASSAFPARIEVPKMGWMGSNGHPATPSFPLNVGRPKLLG